MAHTYTSVSTPTSTYTSVSQIRFTGDTLTWLIIVPEYDTWVELETKGYWSDWYLTYTDEYDSVTKPAYVYSEVTV